MRVSQARISTIERGQLNRAELGTLQAYGEALGGHLKIVADFSDETLVVRERPPVSALPVATPTTTVPSAAG